MERICEQAVLALGFVICQDVKYFLSRARIFNE